MHRIACGNRFDVLSVEKGPKEDPSISDGPSVVVSAPEIVLSRYGF